MVLHITHTSTILDMQGPGVVLARSWQIAIALGLPKAVKCPYGDQMLSSGRYRGKASDLGREAGCSETSSKKSLY